MRTCLAILVVLLLPLAALAQSLDGFACLVRYHVPQTTGRGAIGSGVLIAKHGNLGYVLTCEHVAAGYDEVAVWFPAENASYGGRLVRADRKHDLGLLEISAPQTTPANVADSPPPLGSPLWCSGLGSGGLNHVKGSLSEISERTVCSTGVAPNDGDSGGPIYGPSGVVSVLSAVEWPQHAPSQKAFTGAPHAVLRRFLQGVCYGPYCRPRGPIYVYPSTTSPKVVRPNEPAKPPQPPPLPQPPPKPDTPEPDQPEQDAAAIAKLVIELIKSDTQLQLLLKGDPGEPGSDGIPGQDGMPGEPGSPGEAPDLQSVAVAVAAHLAADATFLESVKGPPGIDGQDGPPGPPGEPGRDGQDGASGQTPEIDVAAIAAAAAAQVAAPDLGPLSQKIDALMARLQTLEQSSATQTQQIEAIARGQMRFRLLIDDQGNIRGAEKQ